MNTITLRAMVKNISSTKKFDNLTFSKNGLFLIYQNELQIEISFSDVDEIYIKKYKLTPFMELICISFPFLFVFMAIQYLPSVMILVCLFSIIPVFLSIINSKWYRFYVRLKDGTSYRKKVATNEKTKIFSIVEKIRAEHIRYNYYGSH